MNGDSKFGLSILFFLIFNLALYAFAMKAESYDPILDVKLTPNRELYIAYQTDYDKVVWLKFPVVMFFQNQPHLCDHPYDDRYQIQFDTGYVIPKEPAPESSAVICKRGENVVNAKCQTLERK